MIDYKRMYTLLCAAASDSLNILPKHTEDESVDWAYFFLQQGLMRAEYVHKVTATGSYGVEGEHE